VDSAGSAPEALNMAERVAKEHSHLLPDALAMVSLCVHCMLTMIAVR
jgi:hypothetical protein